ncbi:MAG: RNA polymerase factor sigma-54 [Sphingomonadales bacterium]|nr:RNA polymerase factor sigma-54 [Sphingomonadales bacterium]
MALSPRLELKHTQTLVMTPQLQQAIKLLQYTNLELNDFVAQEVERNPLLEFGEEEGGSQGDSQSDSEAPQPDAEGAATASDIMLNDGAPQASEALDTDFENVYNNDAAPDRTESGLSSALNGGSGGRTDFSDSTLDFQDNLTAETTLKDHLESQLGLAGFTPPEEMIAHFLIDLVDEAGYIREELQGVAEKLDCEVQEVEAVLARLQEFEPAGVFARSLQECLALQLKERDRYDPAMAALMNNLDLVARRDMAALKRLCGVDDDDLADMIHELKALNPKPGLAFSSETVQVVAPDVFVRRSAKGKWQVELNNDTLPKVLLNARYHAEVAGRVQNKEEKAFVSECLSSANWLVKALDQRARTILKVASEIVRQQEGFFLSGVKHLRPLNLKTIADAIAMHESTVSRVTTNKYLACDRGLFELKYFFTSAIPASGDGEAHSAEAVKERIKELIDAENPADILSDDKLVEILRGQEIDIARRTVAKYREALKIPSSVQRRRLKSLGLQ